MEEVQTYDSLYLQTADGLVPQTSRVKMVVPFKHIAEDGSITSISFGQMLVEDGQGLTFIVDKGVPEEYYKMLVDTSGLVPKLVVKDGETLVGQLTPEEQNIVELEQQLLIAKAKYNNEQITVRESGLLE